MNHQKLRGIQFFLTNYIRFKAVHIKFTGNKLKQTIFGNVYWLFLLININRHFLT